MTEHGDEQPAVQLAPGHVELNAGDVCPRCGEGVLVLIGKTDNGVTLRCFMCGTTGSHDPAVGHKQVVDNPRETPTGFTLSPAQYAARTASDPEEAANEARTAEAGSGTASAAGSQWNG